jgi:hypothetical protein
LNTTIKAYSNQFIGTLKSSFITAKYIWYAKYNWKF